MHCGKDLLIINMIAKFIMLPKYSWSALTSNLILAAHQREIESVKQATHGSPPNSIRNAAWFLVLAARNLLIFQHFLEINSTPRLNYLSSPAVSTN